MLLVLRCHSTLLCSTLMLPSSCRPKLATSICCSLPRCLCCPILVHVALLARCTSVLSFLRVPLDRGAERFYGRGSSGWTAEWVCSGSDWCIGLCLARFSSPIECCQYCLKMSLHIEMIHLGLRTLLRDGVSTQHRVEVWVIAEVGFLKKRVSFLLVPKIYFLGCLPSAFADGPPRSRLRWYVSSAPVRNSRDGSLL